MLFYHQTVCRRQNEKRGAEGLYEEEEEEDQIKQNDKRWVCSTYGQKEKCIKGFGGDTQQKEKAWKSQALMGG